MGLEAFILKKHELRSEEKWKDGKSGIEWSILQNMQKLFFAEILFSIEDMRSNKISSIFQAFLIFSKHNNFDRFVKY